MSSQPEPASEARHQPRLKVPAMYTLARVRAAGDARYKWTGHIYDISLTGMRFELDQPLDPGTQVEVRGMLPGSNHTTFRAAGRIIRLHEDAEESQLGPTRMAMTFDSFSNSADQRRLGDYLTCRALSNAA